MLLFDLGLHFFDFMLPVTMSSRTESRFKYPLAKCPSELKTDNSKYKLELDNVFFLIFKVTSGKVQVVVDSNKKISIFNYFNLLRNEVNKQTNTNKCTRCPCCLFLESKRNEMHPSVQSPLPCCSFVLIRWLCR